jgi:hypothetical protein
MLAFQGCQEVDQLVRLVAAGRIAKRTVDQLLQDEVPFGVFA